MLSFDEMNKHLFLSNHMNCIWGTKKFTNEQMQCQCKEENRNKINQDNILLRIADIFINESVSMVLIRFPNV